MKLIDFHDRFGRSLFAGLIASLVMFGLNLFSYYVLNYSHRRFINWASILVFGRESVNFTETIISSFSTILFSTGLIIIFSYLILKENSRNYIWRGLFVGLASWFAIMSLCYIIGVEKILPIDAPSAISLMITSSIWGLLSAWFLRVLDIRYGTQTLTEGSKQRNHVGKDRYVVPVPAMKKSRNDKFELK